jgi:hypothetical protein
VDGRCDSNPVICPNTNNCQTVQCVEGTGCVYQNKTCALPANACILSTGCDPVTGGCGELEVDCDDGVFCTIDTCDNITGCVNTPDDSLCDDPNPCANYSICNLTGCTSVPIDCGGQGLFCSNFTCVDYFGCSNEPRDCQGNATNGTCTTYNCSETKQICDKVVGVCFNFFGVVIGIVVGALIGGLIGAAALLAGLSVGGVAAAYSSSVDHDKERAVKANPLFKGLGKGQEVNL